jgi:NAD+ synthase (glutamine-hydrolysing)
MRPFLYPARFEHQFGKIDELAEAIPDRSTQPGSDKAKLD